MISLGLTRRKFYYGWVVAIVGAVLMATNSTIINSFGVFFKPLTADFGWSRAETSIAQSLCNISVGIFAILTGWLADRFGRSRILVTCAILLGLGLLLTSRIGSLWQIYLSYGIMAGIGLSSTFTITATTTARWFRERRGLALGITSAGIGLGPLVGVPVVAHLIEAYDWSRAYLILGVAAFAIIVTGAQFLRREPDTALSGPVDLPARPAPRSTEQDRFKLMTVVRTRSLWVLYAIFFLFSFCNQMITVHLVNYATDVGIAPLIAATLMSGVGLSSLAGRISMGGASDRIGNVNVLIIACLASALGLFLLIFARELWLFYLCTIIYGFAYGSENPQSTALIGRLFGFQAMLVGIVHSGSAMGGALGAWIGGLIFDVTGSYQLAFVIAIAVVSFALAGTLVIGRLPVLRAIGKQKAKLAQL